MSKGPEMLERVKEWGDKPADIALFHVKPSDATGFFLPTVRKSGEELRKSCGRKRIGLSSR